MENITCEICPNKTSNHGTHSHICACPPCADARRERIKFAYADTDSMHVCKPQTHDGVDLENSLNS